MEKECAEELRVGETRRDASDKIRGFLYQDLVAIKLMLSLDDSYSCYIEWVEDIYFENESEIILIQVKHYPKTAVDFPEIFSDMYYQFLKFQLISSKKNLKTYCYHYSGTIYDEDECKISLKKLCRESSISDSDKIIIFEELKNCKNQGERKKLLFEKVSTFKLIDKLNFNSSKQSFINEYREEVSQELFDLFKENEIVETFSDYEAKKLLISLSIDYIQKKYYSNSEDCNERRVEKKDLVTYIENALSFDEVKGISLIKSIFFGCADNIFTEILESTDIYDDDVLKKYEKIYIATKKYFDGILNNKLLRFKLLNTVSSFNVKELNFDNYKNYTIKKEKDEYIRHEERIGTYILSLWKLIYNIETDFDGIKINNYLSTDNECLLLQLKSEANSPVLLSSFVQEISRNRQADNIFSRIKKMEQRPQKWYLSGSINGRFSYSYGITHIEEGNKDMSYDYIKDLGMEQEFFNVKCLKCLKCDIGEMGSNDNLDKSLFILKCKNEV